MALCGLFAFTLGYLVGLRFRVAIVIPLEAAALAACTMLALGGSLSVATACWSFMLFSVALQIGYVLALAYPATPRDMPRVHVAKS